MSATIHENQAIASVGTLTLIGSGEMTVTMGRVHRRLMARIHGPVRAVFLDTPAGFQLNADELSARAVDYFERRFGLTLSVASFKNSVSATPAETQAALDKLRSANYIFAGPGSPSYAAFHWRHSPIAVALGERLAAGAHLVFASAAAIATGHYAVPVYEVYKVGEEPHWTAGLDLLGLYGFDLAVVPHWNNQEGGTHDTRYAYLGEPRLRTLEKSLPNLAVILGVDEYTACIIDVAGGACHVMGASGVTIRQKGRERSFAAGESFSVEYLAQGPGANAIALPPPPAPEPAPIQAFPEAESEPESEAHVAAPEGDLVDVLVEVRNRLRGERQWDLADEIRKRLSDLGIILEDSPEGTTWRRF
jgi:hypothetical protein